MAGGAFNELVLGLVRDLHAESERVLLDDVYARLLASRAEIEAALRDLEAGGRVRVEELCTSGPRVIMPL